jgi:8-oxo-dGTP pyrophosphatase MutT (NUDIX family)
LDAGESFVEAAMRETLEEAGVEVSASVAEMRAERWPKGDA